MVYGRRWIGKTTLLRTFYTDRPHTFWVASLNSEALLREGFTQALWQTAHPESPESGLTYTPRPERDEGLRAGGLRRYLSFSLIAWGIVLIAPCSSTQMCFVHPVASSWPVSAMTTL